jgi:hypothetical protein
MPVLTFPAAAAVVVASRRRRLTDLSPIVQRTQALLPILDQQNPEGVEVVEQVIRDLMDDAPAVTAARAAMRLAPLRRRRMLKARAAAAPPPSSKDRLHELEDRLADEEQLASLAVARVHRLGRS